MAIKNVEITNRVLKREGSSGSVSNVPSSLSYELRELANKVDNSFFGKLFSAIDSDGNVIPVNGSATPVRIRANFDFFSVGESSAFGIDSSGGGGGGGGVTVYDGLDSTNPNIALSANQGRVLKGLIDNMDLSDYALKSELATVATSGSYNDLTNKPTIPAAQIQSDWNQTTTTAKDYIKNKPTIPAAQVQSNWNATSGMGVILNKPTKVSAFTNDANYVTSSSLTSTLASYATQTWVTNKGYATTSAMNNALSGYLPLTGGTLSGNLSVERTGTTGGKVTVTNGNGSVSLLTSTNRGIYDDTNSLWLIATNGTNTFLMDGNVGIGTSSPSYKLHVDGDAYATKLYLNGSNFLGGNSTQLYAYIGTANPFVLTSTVVRRGTSDTDVTLGTSSYRWANVYSVLGNFSGLITASGNIKTASYIEIGDYRIVADTANTALKVVNKDGTTAVNFYATGENSALGVNTSGGGGGGDGASLEAVWTSLGDSTGTYGSSQINASHLTSALNGYATQSWVEAKGYLTSYTETDPVFTASAAYWITSTNISTWNGKQDAISDLATIRSNASAGAAKVSNVQADWTATSGLAVILHKPTLATVATSGKYSDLTGTPTKVSDFTNDASYVTSSSLTTTLASYATTSTMNTELAKYLLLTGGTLSGDVTVTKSGTTSTRVKVTNGNGSLSMLASTNRGIYDDDSSKWVIGTNGTNTFLMDGNVGINTTSPSYQLHVNGNTYASRYYAGGANFLGGNSTQLYAYIGTANPFVLTSTVVRRGTSDTDVTLGTSSYRWANVYSVLGNFSGLITASGNISTESYIDIGNYRIISTSDGLKVQNKSNANTPANFYATGEISALKTS